MARYVPDRDAEAIWEAASQWGWHCLVEDGSVFTEGASVWTPGNLDEIDRVFVQSPDLGQDSFLEKLERQLAGTATATRRLMAEAVWVLLLFQSNVGVLKKRENVQTIWGWSGSKLPDDHPLLRDACLIGIGSPGTAYSTQRWRELGYLITLSRVFKRERREERAALLKDPWQFSKWLDAVPRDGYRQFRHIIRHLLFPDIFERISVSTDKRAILAGLAHVSPNELKLWDDERIDRTLLDLRQKLEAEGGTKDIDFYTEDLKGGWRAEPKPANVAIQLESNCLGMERT